MFSVAIWVCILAGCALQNGAYPLLFEMGCELAYPNGESAATGILNYINNVTGLVFLGLFAVPGIGKLGFRVL